MHEEKFWDLQEEVTRVVVKFTKLNCKLDDLYQDLFHDAIVLQKHGCQLVEQLDKLQRKITAEITGGEV